MMKFGSRLRHERNQKGLTQAELARMSGVNQQTISRLEKLDAEGSNLAPKLAKALNLPVGYLLTGEDDQETIELSDGTVKLTGNSGLSFTVHKLIPVPLISYAEAMDHVSAIRSEEVLVPKTDLININCFAVIIPDDANPPLQPGDTIVISPDIKPRPGELIMARTDDGPVVGRFLARVGGVFEVKPYNDVYPSYELPESEIIGTLVYEMRPMIKR